MDKSNFLKRSDFKSTFCKPSYFKLANFIWYQTIWLCAVLFQYEALFFLLALIVVHFIFVESKFTELKLVAMCSLIGIFNDSLLTIFGVFEFAAGSVRTSNVELSTLGVIPIWLVFIWLGFTATFRHSLSFFFKYPLCLCLIASVSAPLTYYAGMRLGAVNFGYELPVTLAILSASWFLMMVLFSVLNRSLERKTIVLNVFSNKPNPSDCLSRKI